MRWLMVFAVGLAGLALAGCGGSNNASSNTTTETTTTTAAETTTGTTTTSGGTTTSGSLTTPNFSSGKCKNLAAASQKISQDLSAAGASGNLQDVAKEFQQFVDAVPSEIKPDVQTLADAFTTYANALKGVNLSSGQTPSAGDLQKMQAALQSLNVKKVQTAERHLTAWTQKNC